VNRQHGPIFPDDGSWIADVRQWRGWADDFLVGPRFAVSVLIFIQMPYGAIPDP
jgi:hypothetical protein